MSDEYEIVFEGDRTVAELDMLVERVLSYAGASFNPDNYDALHVLLTRLLTNYQACEQACLAHTWVKRKKEKKS